jgi:glycolate oxidase FAD binding subunit
MLHADLPFTETLAPANQAEVAQTVCEACGKGLALYPIGGGTRLHNGAKPTRPGVGISLAKLNRVIDHPTADLTITVEAGMTIAELTNVLASQRQRLPIDIPHPERATVGGAVAVNAAGPRRYAYGTMRDYVLGFTAVDGTGTTFSGGGRVVKNAAGYNMCRLMAGSHGTLGILTQITLMVRPMCEASVLFVCDVPDFELAERLLAGLVRSPARPVAIEFAAGRQRDSDVSLGPVLQGNVGRLHVGFEGPAAEVDWMVEQLRSEWATSGATAPMLVPTPRAEPLWRWLAEFPTAEQFNVLPGQTIEKIVELLQIDPTCAIQAHAGDGVICVNTADSRGLTARGEVADGIDSPKTRVMRAIKDRFDPQGILNPE